MPTHTQVFGVWPWIVPTPDWTPHVFGVHQWGTPQWFDFVEMNTYMETKLYYDIWLVYLQWRRAKHSQSSTSSLIEPVDGFNDPTPPPLHDGSFSGASVWVEFFCVGKRFHFYPSSYPGVVNAQCKVQVASNPQYSHLGKSIEVGMGGLV